MELQIVTIREATDEYPRHSEASVVELPNGRLLIAWQEYVQSEHGAADLAPNRIAAMISTDKGLSWEEHRILVEPEKGDVNVYSPSFLYLPNGELLLFNFRYQVFATGERGQTTGVIRRSTDNGQTFSEPQIVWADKPYTCASSVMKMLSGGRIIIPITKQTGFIWTKTDHIIVGSIYSDDGGTTWHESENWVDLPLRGAMEPHLEELVDGRLLMVMRTQLGSVFKSYSRNQGVTWSLAQTTGLMSPESCPELVRIPQTGELMIAWNNSPYDPRYASHYGKRTPLTIARSQDEGETWIDFEDIESDQSFGYFNPACTFMKSGEGILTYCVAPYDESGYRGGTRLLDLKAAVLINGSCLPSIC